MSDICNELNEEAWNKYAYEAWVKKFGTPSEAAERIRQAPEKSLAVIYEKLPDVREKRIVSVMGSNGTKAVALACLGASASVIDFSEGNRRYALELAAEAGAEIEYFCENIIALPEKLKQHEYDIAIAEIGILHYFTDLEPFMRSAGALLKRGGLFILRDFHPVSNKLLVSRGTTAKIRKHKVAGDYFSTELVESPISFAKYVPELETQTVLLRKWNLGEVITAMAQAGFIIESLDEEPNMSCEQYDKGIPKTFTVTARLGELK